ncbi:MAG: DNA-directed RNA polymerase subunit alpha [Acholeplasmatales bacterium]|jgi:DNA-directed RNA polymerase subunit alpha|nr:DNA-directed RNA polymerase subunit alpha [Acholeplasmatales bacterium]
MKDLKIKRPSFEVSNKEENKILGRYVIKPLERGYGDTLGTALRRTLLASIPGAAITCVKIDGVTHEFSTIEGVYEDVVKIVLNLKKVVIKVDSEDDNYEQVLTLVEYGPKKVTAGDFGIVNGLEIINPDLHLATLEDGAKLSMEVIVNRGAGYVSFESNKSHLTIDGHQRETGYFAIDSLFAPVTRVAYHVEKLMDDEDELVIEVETNGTVLPKDALGNAAKILSDYLNVIVSLSEIAKSRNFLEDEKKDTEKDDVIDKNMPVGDFLDLVTKSANALQRENIRTIGDLIQLSEREVSKIPGIGVVLFKEISARLKEKGLSLAPDIEEQESANEELKDSENLEEEDSTEVAENEATNEEGEE